VIMGVYEAVTSRRAVRGFTDQHVPREVLERVLSAAAWSPSGSNLQPWNSYVLTGAALAELKKRALARGRRRPLGRAAIRGGPARTEVPVPRAPRGLRQGALRRTRYFARGHGGASEGRCRELELFRCARRPVLLHRPRPGRTPMGRRRHVSADRHAAAPRRRA